MSFFAPHSEFANDSHFCEQIREFKEMVKQLHAANIEVILDVVYNHTDEGGNGGLIYSWKGLDSQIYYIRDQQGNYLDFTGTGNTFNCNHPVSIEIIKASLEYWVTEMHVDGFRLDEGAILARGPDGNPMTYPPVLWALTFSHTLRYTKIIAGNIVNYSLNISRTLGRWYIEHYWKFPKL